MVEFVSILPIVIPFGLMVLISVLNPSVRNPASRSRMAKSTLIPDGVPPPPT